MKQLDLDQMTRQLMEGQTEAPSKDLNLHIMETIMQEKRAQQNLPDLSVPSLTNLLVGLGLFLLLTGVVLGAFRYAPEQMKPIGDLLEQYGLFGIPFGVGVTAYLLLDQWGKKMDREWLSRSK